MSDLSLASAVIFSLLWVGIYLPGLLVMRSGRPQFLIAWLIIMPLLAWFNMLGLAFILAIALTIISAAIFVNAPR